MPQEENQIIPQVSDKMLLADGREIDAFSEEAQAIRLEQEIALIESLESECSFNTAGLNSYKRYLEEQELMAFLKTLYEKYKENPEKFDRFFGGKQRNSYLQ